MDNEEIKQLLRDSIREQNEKWHSYLTGGREDIARMQETILHLTAMVESLNVFVVKGNGEKGLIVSVPRMAGEMESIQAQVRALQDWKATALKRENWLKFATVVGGIISALILAWIQLRK